MRSPLRCPRPLVAAAALAAALSLLASPATAGASSTDQAVAYQLDPSHDGYQTDDPLTTPLSQAWSITLSGAVSYPLIVNGVVYVTANDSGGSGTTLYALEQATGATLWAHDLGGVYHYSGIAYDAGQVFALNNSGVLTAYNASTGASNWSTTLTGQSEFTNPPTAGDGFVYAAGAGTGTTAYAVSEQTGAVAWSQRAEGGDESAPVVTPTGVYFTFECNRDYDFNPYTGTQIWSYADNCTGGGGTTPVFANGDIYDRDSLQGNLVLSGGAGSNLGTFSSTFAPAAGGGNLYTAGAGTLSAVGAWGLGSAIWSFTSDSQLDTAPLVDGSLVFAGSAQRRALRAQRRRRQHRLVHQHRRSDLIA